MDKNIGILSHEVTYRRFRINNDRVGRVFHILSISEYIALYAIMKSISQTEQEHKIFLKDIASEMDIPLGHASKIARNLKDKGYIIWTHEGTGNEGTYIEVTESGIRNLTEQERILKEYYQNIINQIGQEKLMQWLLLTQEIETVMEQEASKMED